MAENGFSEPVPVAILGAGVCGLYAARVLAGQGVPVVVLEKETIPGGLATSYERAGNYYDTGVHQLQTFDREIFEDIHAIMGDRLLPVGHKALIRYGTGYRRYPLEFFDLLKSIPPWTLLRALGGLVFQQIRNKVVRREAANAEEALIRLYGRPLYEYFFRDFTHLYWGIPASGLSATFVRTKMPRLSAVDFLKKGLAKLGLRIREQAVDSALGEETVWYPPTGVRELSLALASYIQEHGGQVLLESPVAAVEIENDRVTAVRCRPNGDTLTQPCSHCISTIPVPDLVRSILPAPPDEVLEACDHLNYKPIAIYGLLVRKPKAMEALYIYYRGRIFHRVAEPKNSGLRVQPEDYTTLIVEMTCEEGDDRWNGGEETVGRIFADLEAEGLARRDEVAEVHLLRMRHGYPIFKLGFEPYHEKIKAYLGKFENLRSVGRQGGFLYPNMHGAMRMGADAARSIIQASSKGASRRCDPQSSRMP